MTFKKCWKTKPLWLKFGIYAVLIYLITILILIPFGTAPGIVEIPYWGMFSFYIGIPIFWFIHTIFNLPFQLPGGLWPMLVSSIVHSFIFGALIGLIVAKIKPKPVARKKQAAKTKSKNKK